MVKSSGCKILFLSVFFGLGQNFCVRKTPDDATAQGIEDVERIRKLDSRRFEVTCYDGTREIRTKNDLLSENVCNFSRSNDIRAFCVQIAEHVHRSEILRIMPDNLFVFSDRGPNLSLRHVFFGVPHCLCFVESHRNLLPQGFAAKELKAGSLSFRSESTRRYQ